MPKCKNIRCQREFTLSRRNKHQVYCSKPCAPYGNWKDDHQTEKKLSIYEKNDDSKQDESFLM